MLTFVGLMASFCPCVLWGYVAERMHFGKFRDFFLLFLGLTALRLIGGPIGLVGIIGIMGVGGYYRTAIRRQLNIKVRKAVIGNLRTHTDEILGLSW